MSPHLYTTGAPVYKGVNIAVSTPESWHTAPSVVSKARDLDPVPPGVAWSVWEVFSSGVRLPHLLRVSPLKGDDINLWSITPHGGSACFSNAASLLVLCRRWRAE